MLSSETNMMIWELSRWGADTGDALQRVVGDIELYHSLLLEFAVSDECDRLKIALEEADFLEAFALAHDLKGVSATLGLTPLYDILKDMVEVLRALKSDPREPKDLAQELRSLKAEFQRLQVKREEFRKIFEKEIR